MKQDAVSGLIPAHAPPALHVNDVMVPNSGWTAITAAEKSYFASVTRAYPANIGRGTQPACSVFAITGHTRYGSLI